MIKHVFVGFLNGVNEIDAVRWYLRYHSKEVVRFVGPWLRRYETYKSYPPPLEAKRFGVLGGFMTELWYEHMEDFIEAKANYRPYTYAP
jgi:predicted outer membrane lipoprotein